MISRFWNNAFISIVFTSFMSFRDLKVHNIFVLDNTSTSKRSSWTCVSFDKLWHILASACYFNQSDRFPNHEQILQLETAVHTCKCLQSLTTHVLGGNISFGNKIPLVLPFKGFPPMTKQVTNSFFTILLSFTPLVSGCCYSDYSKNPKWLNIAIQSMTESLQTEYHRMNFCERKLQFG